MSDEFEELEKAVRANLPEADDVMISIVTAVAGLLATVAYADRDHSDAEREEIRAQLHRIEALNERAVTAIVEALERHILHLSTKYVQRFTRILCEQADASMRLEVLDVLLGVAAADGTISHEEIIGLRNLTNALALSQSDYNHLQSKYKKYLHFSS